MSGMTPDNSDSDSTPELLEHDREGAALAVCIDKWRNSQPMVSGRSFARQASDNLIEVFSNFAESPRDERYDLLSIVSLGGLEWAYHRARAIPDHISRKFPVNGHLSELRPTVL